MKRATTPTKTTKIMQKTRITPRGNIFVLDSRKKRVRTKKKNNGSNVKNLWEKPTFGQSCCFDLESKSNSLQKRFFHQEFKNKKKKRLTVEG